MISQRGNGRTMDKPWERVELPQTMSSLHFWGWGVWGPNSSLGPNISETFGCCWQSIGINSTFAGFLICFRLLPLCTDFVATSPGVASHSKLYLEMFTGTL